MSWEKGRDVFDRLLIDGDPSLNSGNWMWLSASSFFYQYFRVYSPVTYGKKYDPEGKYVRHFLPVLKVHPHMDSSFQHSLVSRCTSVVPLTTRVEYPPRSSQTCCLEAGVSDLPNVEVCPDDMHKSTY